MVHDYLGLERNAGLTTALVGAADLQDLLQPWGDDDLFVLTSGQIPPNPSELLGSAEMGALLERLEQDFDTVIVDAPPLLPVTDAAVLSQFVGGIVLVVGSHKIKHQDLQKSLSALDMVGATLLGVVLNRLPSRGRTRTPTATTVAMKCRFSGPRAKSHLPPFTPRSMPVTRTITTQRRARQAPFPPPLRSPTIAIRAW